MYISIILKMCQDCDRYEVDDEDGYTCGPCELEHYEVTVLNDCITFYFTSFTLVIRQEQLNTASFDENGTLHCDSLFNDKDGEILPIWVKFLQKKYIQMKPESAESIEEVA